VAALVAITVAVNMAAGATARIAVGAAVGRRRRLPHDLHAAHL
jgi:hypothetical protein